ncbi:class I SAM-dependent methyltransferase [Allokutzneria albata]|uniref:Methyltransferase domain-containing protein n=1 Tax=Allokutzneria albata TaxID=211114 RepID=A0A1H0DR67_ALLAB|nr:class I SAM-dependent methyltransferase [Allokutzneria albata]SDN72664.1 Methyltransferase domain-containing protein [Allokutzneria albata]
MSSRTGPGEAYARACDRPHSGRDDISTLVDFVRTRTDPAVLLELGVGTGRLAIPLAKAGVRAYGVDSSPAMLARLRAKDPEGLVTVFEGCMTEPPITAPFGCVLIASDTFALLPDRVAWAKCFGAAAQRLSADGRLIIEGALPDPASWGGPSPIPRPEELDLLAGNVALRLTERYEDYAQQPFTLYSPKCVSVYQRVL